MTKHTPEPWKAEILETLGNKDAGYLDRYTVIASDDTIVCDLPDHPSREAKRLATLIAAAPELLEALQQIAWKLERKESPSGNGDDCVWAKIDRNDAVMTVARAAIAKERGEK